MRDRSAREAAAVVAAYDFTAFGSIIDVGGGGGVLLSAILAVAPDVSGVLFDRPEVAARSTLPAVAGDFFVEVPKGADPTSCPASSTTGPTPRPWRSSGRAGAR